MKYIKIVLFIIGINLIFSCEDPLERGPLDIISDDILWESESLLDLYVANLYSRSEFVLAGADTDTPGIGRMVAESCAGGYNRTFGGWPSGYKFTQGKLTDQGDGTGGSNDVLGYWKYDLVRDINLALERIAIDDSPFSSEYKDARLGELHFLRAQVYFQMVKRYGGVPIIDKVQSIDTPMEELSVARSSETEVYDFIEAELILAEQFLAGKTLEYGRATAWAALALKSRAMMYAGSIGLFGEMQLEGLLGISDANKYWKKSYDASKKIINEGGFSLYGMGSSNPEKDYYDLFTKAEQNSETILAEVFDGEGSKGEDWERWCAPQSVDGTTFFNTYLETFEMFEYTDGSSGKLDRSTLVEGVFHDMADFIGKKDPRCRADLFLPECSYLGNTIYLHEGMYVDGIYYNSGDLGLEVPTTGFKRDYDRTSIFNKKRSNEEYDVHSTTDIGGTDYMIYRLGEIYLNLAEAAYALNKPEEALEALNMIRRRVNMPDKTEINWEVIQNERAVELFFEGHRYWDLRRWRTAVDELNSSTKTFSGVKWRKDYSNPGMYEVIWKNSGSATDSWPRVFAPHHYYMPITLARVQNSPALVENPGY